MVFSLIYIDRLIQSGGIPVNSLTIHRVLIASAVLAIKFFDDAFYLNSHYAKVGGISVDELSLLELEFLKNINFSLHVTCEDYQKYHNELYMHVTNGFCPCCRMVMWVELQVDHSSLPLLVNSGDFSGCLCYLTPKLPNESPRNFVHDYSTCEV